MGFSIIMIAHVLVAVLIQKGIVTSSQRRIIGVLRSIIRAPPDGKRSVSVGSLF
jgi:hypothetical protein